MGYVPLAARELTLTNIVNSCNSDLLKIAKKRMDLHKYGSHLSDGILSLDEIAGTPMGLRPFALQYALQGQVGAVGGYDAQTGQMSGATADAFLLMQNLNPEQQTMSMFNNIFEHAFKARINEAKKAEEARIKAIEDELDMKQKQIETRLQAAEKELQSVEKAKEAAINRCTPKYA